MLFSRIGIEVDSFETNQEFMRSLYHVCNKNIRFHWWDNKELKVPLREKYDLAIVDGERPRFKQAAIAREHSDMILVHDVGASSKGVPEQELQDFVSIPNSTKRCGVYVKKNACQ